MDKPITKETETPLKLSELVGGLGLLAFAAVSIVTVATILGAAAFVNDRRQKWGRR